MSTRWPLATLIAVLALTACARQPAEPAVPGGEAVLPEGAPAEAGATVTEVETKSLPTVGIATPLPSGWAETETPADFDMGEGGTAATLKKGEGELPRIVFSRMAPDSYQKLQTAMPAKGGKSSLAAIAQAMKDALVKGDAKHQPTVSNEEPYEAMGVAEGLRMRVKGYDDKLGDSVGDLVFAETRDGALCIIMAQAKTEAELAETDTMLAGLAFEAPIAATGAPAGDDQAGTPPAEGHGAQEK